jgi:hypothetical protein
MASGSAKRESRDGSGMLVASPAAAYLRRRRAARRFDTRYRGFGGRARVRSATAAGKTGRHLDARGTLVRRVLTRPEIPGGSSGWATNDNAQDPD